MKNQNKQHRTVQAACVVFATYTLVLPTFAAQYSWSVSSNLFPDQVEPAMMLINTATPEQPILHPTDLLLATDESSEKLFYHTIGTNLDMPTQLVIEAELRYVSSEPLPACPGVAIGFITAPRVHGLLGIGQDSIYLRSAWPGCDGPSVTVDTDDAFHLYRIEVDAPTSLGSAIRVFYDGSLVLTGATIAFPVDVAPEIWFGDGTTSGYGNSRWRSFRHNAARDIEPRMSIRVSQVEVCWASRSNDVYNVQYRSDLATDTWVNLFTNVVGVGAETCVSDAVPRGQPQRYYRVEVVR